MTLATIVWSDIPDDWSPIAFADNDLFVFDCTDKLAEVANDYLVGTPTFAAYLPEAPTTPSTDLVFGAPTLTANNDGLALQMVLVNITAPASSTSTPSLVYKVTMTFSTAARGPLHRSQLLTVEQR